MQEGVKEGMHSLDRLGISRGSPGQSFPQVLSTLLGAPNPSLKVLQEELLPAYTGQDPQGRR